jgi:hypothetical protein
MNTSTNGTSVNIGCRPRPVSSGWVIQSKRRGSWEDVGAQYDFSFVGVLEFIEALPSSKRRRHRIIYRTITEMVVRST